MEGKAEDSRVQEEQRLEERQEGKRRGIPRKDRGCPKEVNNVLLVRSVGPLERGPRMCEREEWKRSTPQEDQWKKQQEANSSTLHIHGHHSRLQSLWTQHQHRQQLLPSVWGENRGGREDE